MTPDDLARARDLVAAATPGPWHWAGNTDTGEPYLATWIPGAGRCQVLAIGSEERSTTGRAADQVRRNAEEFDLGDPEDLVEQWVTDDFTGLPKRDPRLQFVTDLMCVNARDHVVYEVAPEATSRDDKAVYRADIVDIRHPDAKLIAAAPDLITRLLDYVERLQREAYEAHGDLVLMAMETGWETDGELSTGVRHVKEVLRRRTAERGRYAAQVAAVRDLAERWATTGDPATKERQAALKGAARRIHQALDKETPSAPSLYRPAPAS